MAIMDTDRANLYHRWRHLKQQPIDPLFEKFDSFYEWALKSGYEPGARLLKKDLALPYSPNNCEWQPVGKEMTTEFGPNQIAKRNRTVNVFRKACGLPLFETDPSKIKMPY